jgi:hypothetical protein
LVNMLLVEKFSLLFRWLLVVGDKNQNHNHRKHSPVDN